MPVAAAQPQPAIGTPAAVSQAVQQFPGQATTAANKFLSVTGGKSIADNIGTLGGYLYTKAKDAFTGRNDAATYDLSAPSPLQTTGDAAKVALTALPVGKVAEGAAVGAKALGVAAKYAKPVGEAATSVGTGYAYDVANNASQGKTGASVAKPGVGTVTGAALPVVGAAASGLQKIAAGTAPRLINSLIKPLGKDFSYGKDPGRTVAELGITGNTLDGLAKNISTAKKNIGTELQATAASLPPTSRVSLSPALKSLDEAMQSAVANNDQPLLTRLKSTRDALTSVFSEKDGKIVPVGSRMIDDLTYAQGVDFKRRIGDLTKWTGQQTEDKTVNGALTRAYGAVKEQLDQLASSADPATAAKLRKLNQQYADLTSAEVATKYRDVLQQRQNLINLPGKLGLTAAAIASPFTGGLSTIAAAAGSVAADKALSSPAFKTRAASALSKFGKGADEAGLFNKIPGLKGATAPGDALVDSFKGSNPQAGNAKVPVVAAGGASAAALYAGSKAIKGNQVSYTRDVPHAVASKGSQLASAIEAVETGGKQVKGASGEFGSFQFEPETWKIVSKQVAGKVLPQTAKNEKEIATAKITKLYQRFKAEGLSDLAAARNTALVWNTSLGGAEKPLVKKGVNKKGVKFDSDAYAKKVVSHFGSS